MSYAQIVLGTAILAFAVVMFLSPHELVFGGATGLGIITQAVGRNSFSVEIPLWLTNIIINTPLFLWAARVKGISFLKRTGIATALLSLFLYLFGLLPALALDGHLLLAALFGGAIAGVGLGLVFRNMATTGGSDLAAMIVKHYRKHMTLSRLMFIIDAVVISAGFFVFGPVKALYAIIGVYTSSRTIAGVLDGLSFAKAAFIISDNGDAISAALLSGLSRGATVLDGRGMYTGSSKNVIICVVSQKEIVQLKEIVSATDREAFVIVSDVREVMGKGFAPHQA